jgi:chitodextrinase
VTDATQELILGELRALRSDFNIYARQTGERISALETDMHDLKGNGQPGRVGLLERAVTKLSQRMWWAIGAAAGASGVISVLVWVVKETSR